MNGVLFDGWAAVGRPIVIVLCAYISLIALLRVSGKRTLSKMKAVVLETDGSLSVIQRQDGGTRSSLADVR